MNIVDYETDEGNEDHEKYKKELEQRGFTPAQFLERMRRARQAGGANKTQMFQVRPDRLLPPIHTVCAEPDTYGWYNRMAYRHAQQVVRHELCELHRAMCFA